MLNTQHGDVVSCNAWVLVNLGALDFETKKGRLFGLDNVY